jgi:hypothetical protein
VQKYAIVRNEGLPDEFELVGTAVGPTAAARELNADPNMRATPAGITKACKDSLEYRGHRWLTVPHVDLEVPQQLKPTAYVMREKSPLIAMIDLDKTYVVHVFEDQSIAAERRKVGSSALSKAINQKKQSSGHFWMHWNDVSAQMRDAYLQTHTLPGCSTGTGAIPLELVDPRDGTVKEHFDSTQEAIDKMQVSRCSIESAVSDGLPMKGYVWREC